MNERALVGAVDRSLAESFRQEAQYSPEGRIVEEGGLLLCCGPGRLPLPPNVAMCTGAVDPQAAFARTQDFYGSRGSGYAFQMRMGDDDELLRLACSHDPLLTVDAAVLFRRAPLDPPDGGIDIRQVTDDAGTAAYAAAIDQSFQSLGWPAGAPAELFSSSALLLQPTKAAFVAFGGRQPLAAAHVQLADGVGQVSWVGTVPGARGRGLGEAVTRAATNAGFTLGAEVVWLTASPMGEPLYRRLGFDELVRSRQVLLWPGVAGTSVRAADRSGRRRPEP